MARIGTEQFETFALKMDNTMQAEHNIGSPKAESFTVFNYLSLTPSTSPLRFMQPAPC
jgi:hypothetical protein